MALHPSPSAPVERQQLALVSFWLSLVFPLVLLLNLFIFGVAVHVPLGAVLLPLAQLLLPLSYVLDLLGVCALIAAIVTGHVALRRTRPFPSPQARRGMAVVGLVLGYLSLTVILGIVGLSIWFATHPIRMHLVF